MRNPLFFVWPLLVAILAAGCGDKIPPGTTSKDSAAPLTVETAVAHLERAPRRYEAVGTVQARQTATLAAKVMGTIQSVNAREGDPVARDAVLVTIVQQQLDAAFTGARAGLEAAGKAKEAAGAARRAAAAQADLAASTYRRYQTLAIGESASAQELDEVKSRHEAAAAALARADAALEAAEQQVMQARAAVVAAAASRGDTLVRAPFDGKVTARLVEPGDLAAPGRPLLTLEAGEGFRVEMFLPEDRLAAVRPGQNLAVNLPALNPEWFPAPVETILPTADSATRSVAVRLGLPAMEGIGAGMFARVQVPVGETEIISIPEAAVVHQGQLAGVFRVDADQTARFTLVRTGLRRDGRIEILSGIGGGERFVVAPPPDLHHGRRVKEAS